MSAGNFKRCGRCQHYNCRCNQLAVPLKPLDVINAIFSLLVKSVINIPEVTAVICRLFTLSKTQSEAVMKESMDHNAPSQIPNAGSDEDDDIDLQDIDFQPGLPNQNDEEKDIMETPKQKSNKLDKMKKKSKRKTPKNDRMPQYLKLAGLGYHGFQMAFSRTHRAVYLYYRMFDENGKSRVEKKWVSEDVKLQILRCLENKRFIMGKLNPKKTIAELTKLDIKGDVFTAYRAEINLWIGAYNEAIELIQKFKIS